jgi:primosomal protein N' (replication factor Y)
VPFGTRELVGWVSAIGVTETLPEALKPILQRLDRTPVMTAELLQTLRWTAHYYQAPLGEVLSAAVPALLREGKAPPDVCVYAWQLTAEGDAGIDSLRRTGKPQALAMRLRSGALSEALLDSDTPGWRSSMRSLQARTWVERIALNRSEMAGTKPEEEGPALNADQAACVQALKASAGFGVHLIEGVTGSGKTEIYIQAVRDCLARGRQALVLVPEIGLTPQTMARFRARLPVPVHVLHSNLSDGDRAQAWTAMAEGIGRVLLGTRSAVFTPMPEAGLVIVDEEHDSSYKQQDGFHYHARDVAVLRAKSLNVPVLLGSATPSLESWHNTDIGRYQRHRLPERAGAAKPPTVRITDIRKIRLQHGLSQSMLDGIAACLNDGGQALVFKNRRGYAPALLCHDCGFTAQCPRCDTALTLHAGQRRLHCHHCGHQKPKPPACPDCGSLALQPQGFGTERLEEALEL